MEPNPNGINVKAEVKPCSLHPWRWRKCVLQSAPQRWTGRQGWPAVGCVSRLDRQPTPSAGSRPAPDGGADPPAGPPACPGYCHTAEGHKEGRKVERYIDKSYADFNHNCFCT